MGSSETKWRVSFVVGDTAPRGGERASALACYSLAWWPLLAFLIAGNVVIAALPTGWPLHEGAQMILVSLMVLNCVVPLAWWVSTLIFFHHATGATA